jgi:tRNA(Ile2) C34 agmatinyltransferase TiaS
MTRHYFIKASVSDKRENMHLCPICHKETKESGNSCPGCGYKFPTQTRRSKVHRESLISFPRSADTITGKESIFL